MSHRLCLLACLLLACGCDRTTSQPVIAPPSKSEDAPAGPVLFRDITAQTGIDFTYRNGEESDHFAILESLGGGVALLDYDADGDLDVFLPGGGYFDKPKKQDISGYPGKLYRNDGGLRFTDVTTTVGLTDAPFYTHGAAVGDYNNDGYPDLLITGYGRVAFFANTAGTNGRTFVDKTKEAGLMMDRHFWGTSAAWADFDGDGFADLYICQYVNWSWQNDPPCPGYSTRFPRDVCPPKQFQSVPHALFRNLGNGTFVEVTREAGIRWETMDKDYGKGLGVLACDVNADRKPDLYICNDTTDNFLYVNDSEPGKIRFKDVGFNLGVARDGGGIPNGSMGVDAADYDGSGRPSIWVTNYENEFHALYRNETRSPDKLGFTYATPAAGIGAIGPKYVGFGTQFIDANRDGWPDIIIANGHVVRYPPNDNLRQSAVLLLNEEANGRRKFRFSNTQAGSDFIKPVRGRGFAIGDLDNDGAAELIFSCVEEPVRILKNDVAQAHPDRHWIGLELRGAGNRTMVGSRFTLEQDGQKQTGYVKGGVSYLSSPDRRHQLGLNVNTGPATLTVEWSTGEPKTEVFRNLTIDRYHQIEQGKGG